MSTNIARCISFCALAPCAIAAAVLKAFFFAASFTGAVAAPQRRVVPPFCDHFPLVNCAAFRPRSSTFGTIDSNVEVVSVTHCCSNKIVSFPNRILHTDDANFPPAWNRRGVDASRRSILRRSRFPHRFRSRLPCRFLLTRALSSPSACLAPVIAVSSCSCPPEPPYPLCSFLLRRRRNLVSRRRSSHCCCYHHYHCHWYRSLSVRPLSHQTR